MRNVLAGSNELVKPTLQKPFNLLLKPSNDSLPTDFDLLALPLTKRNIIGNSKSIFGNHNNNIIITKKLLDGEDFRITLVLISQYYQLKQSPTFIIKAKSLEKNATSC